MDDTLQIAIQVARIFDALGVAYHLCGSLASSQHGRPRSTLDADMVADIKPEHVQPLLAALGEAWYADAPAMQQAIRDRASFNLIHLGSGQKVDVFVFKGRRFDYQQMAAAKRMSIHGGDYQPYYGSAEHTLLAKLDWYRQGGELSERQWDDMLGILEIQGDHLDLPAIQTIAHELDLSDLLAKLLRQSST